MPKRKEKIESSEEADKQKEIKKGNKQIYFTIAIMVILVAIFFFAYFMFESFNKFEHKGLTFTKERFGSIPVFHYYYYIAPDLQYNLYLRNDPRENTVPFTGRAIEIFKLDVIYVSVDPENLTQCEYSRVGISTLASFLADNQFDVKGATPNATLANETNVVHATCESTPGNPVIEIKASDKTEILHNTRNCFEIKIANCEVLPAIEKFQVQMILDARERSLANSN